jgi:osmoprotectant transport system permease protein
VLWRVELPLALPVIVAGLRQATVMVVAIATVGATVGANDLGQPLLEGIRGDDRDAIFAGALLVGLLGVTADALLAALERGLSRGRTA